MGRTNEVSSEPSSLRAKGYKLVDPGLPLGSEIADKGKRLSGFLDLDSAPLITSVDRHTLTTQSMDSGNEITFLYAPEFGNR